MGYNSPGKVRFLTFSEVRVVHNVKLHGFTFLVSCCDVRYNFIVKTMFGFSWQPDVLQRVHVLFMLFVFILLTRFLYQMTFMPSNSNARRVSPVEQKLPTLSRAHMFTPGF